MSLPNEAAISVEDRNGAKCLCVTLAARLDPGLERWFLNFLYHQDGVAYVAFNEGLQYLTGYGVWHYAWISFRFWLEVNLEEDYEPV
jgi:hypothetical protein